MANLTDLTPRELETLHLALSGKANKAIASEVSISAKTVEIYLDKLYKKIGVQARMITGLRQCNVALKLGKFRASLP